LKATFGSARLSARKSARPTKQGTGTVAARKLPTNSSSLPLTSVRVIDLSRYLAGPYCGSILADLGAEVIRVEPVGGGEDRGLVPLGEDTGGALFLQANRNKKSLALDIKQSSGRRVLERLIATADVVLTNMPASALRKQSLDRVTLERIKPAIITANVSAFGTDGRLSERNGFDGIGQAMSGAAYLGGKRNHPVRAGCSYVDYGAGLAAAVGVLAALIHRSQTGVGQDVQASLLATAITFANGWHIEESVRRLDRRPFGNCSPNSAPSDVYRTQDGFIVVHVIGRQMFARWAKLIGRPEFISDPKLQTDAARGKAGPRLSRVMNEWTQQRTSTEAIETLTRSGVPAGPVYSPRQLLDDELVTETGIFQYVAHPGLDRPAPLAAPIVRLTESDPAIRRPAPSAGQHTVEILKALGMTPAEIESLALQRTISCGLQSQGENSRKKRPAARPEAGSTLKIRKQR
jgi:crotonobetainyl-CoA:carnitine CoA-transferase CaiB-like acyl-CoA transferase